MLWQAKMPTLVLPAGKKWPVTVQSKAQLADQGWQLCSRKTGGAPVPQLPGVINLSHIYHWPRDEAYNIQKAYLHLCNVLTMFLKSWASMWMFMQLQVLIAMAIIISTSINKK